MRIPNKRVGNIGPIHYSKLLLLFLPLSIALVLACAGEPAVPPATAVTVPTSTFPAPISTPQLPAISNQGIPSPEQQLGTHPSLATASPEPTREKLAMQKSGEEMPHPLYKLIKPHFSPTQPTVYPGKSRAGLTSSWSETAKSRYVYNKKARPSTLTCWL